MRRFAIAAVALGTTIASVLMLAAGQAHATFPGENGRISLSIDRGFGPRIYTLRHDGSRLRRVTDANTGSAVTPDWSPDGRRIVFGVLPPGEDSSCTIEIMKADGSGLHRVAGSVRHRHCFANPAFAPNGHRIVATLRQEKIRSMDLHGRNRRTILDITRICANTTYPDCTVDRLQVSPDGRAVAFELSKHHTDGTNRKALYTVGMNGAHVRQIVPFSYDVCICGGDWAPNGRRILFSDHAGDGVRPQTEPTNLATIRPDGNGLRYITNFRRTDILVGRGSYSPNGRWILFKVNKDGAYALWKIRPDGSHQTLIARMESTVFVVDWGSRAS